MRQLVLFAFAMASGCFYDSSWGSAKRAQSHNAAHAAPAAIGSDDHDHRAAHVRRCRLVAYVSDRYAAQEIDWDRSVRDVVAGASDVLGPELGITLDVERAKPWNPGDDAELPRVLDALHREDDGTSDDWVVGFVGALPKLSKSFHDAGYADVIGKHLVVRAAPTERAAIDQAFDKLSDAERERLARERKSHRAIAVFLHEIGHTLGAIHETDAKSPMAPTYDPAMSGFSDDALALMQVTLDHRGNEQTNDEKKSYATDMLAVLNQSSRTGWLPAERAALIARLRPPPMASAAPSAPPTDDTPELKAADRDAWRKAAQLARDGDFDGAWRVGQPIFNAYPAVYKVQDLRCTIAMKVVGWPGAQAECEPLMKLTSPR
ncbi:MAG TPA: M12 family metallo-peptidase [Polyangiaceae bacterium]|jgi:hypothetical protein